MYKAAARFALLLLPAFAPACFTSSAAPPPSDDASDDAAVVGQDASSPDATVPEGSAPEAGLDASPDAAADSSPDASPPEASVEAGAPVVSAVVRSAFGPEQGVTIVFEDAAGAVLATAITDASGVASQAVGSATEITAIMGTELAPQLVTIQGVAAGDVLAFYDAKNDTIGVQLSIDLAPDAAPPPGTSAVYAQVGDCTAGAVPTSLDLYSPKCQSQGKFPVYLYAQAGADGGYQTLGYTSVKGVVAPTDGGVVSVIAPGPWQTATAVQVVVAQFDGDSGIPDIDIGLDELANEVAMTSNTSFNTNLEAGTQSANFLVHPGYDDDLQAEAYYFEYPGSGRSLTGLAQRGLGDSGTSTLDLTGSLPAITSSMVDPSTPARPTMSWVSAGSLVSAKGVLAQVAWSDTTDAGLSVLGSWVVVMPSSAAMASTPALPGAFAPWLPTSTSTFAQAIITAVDADFLPDYAHLRAQAGSFPISASLASNYTEPVVPPLPAGGTLKFTAFTYTGGG